MKTILISIRSGDNWNTPLLQPKESQWSNLLEHWRLSKRFTETMVLGVYIRAFGSISVSQSPPKYRIWTSHASSRAVRDTAGTALYFLEYDGMRHLLGRQRSGEQGPTPSWLPIHSSLVPFVCGSVSGVNIFSCQPPF